MPTFMPLQEPSREQLREQIRQTVRDAQVAAEQAAKDAREAAAAGENVAAGPLPPRPPGVPATMVPPWQSEGIPTQAVDISIAFFMMVAAIVIGLPIMRAIARRIERGTPVAAPMPVEVKEQLLHISQSVDAIAIEVERISEAQRFTTKMLAEKSELPRLDSGQP